MTRRGIRQQRGAVSQAKRVWLLPEPQDPNGEQDLADTLDDVWRQLAEESIADPKPILTINRTGRRGGIE